MLRRFTRRPQVAWLILAASFVIARLLLLPVVPAPEPKVHDEFGYLLAADAFVHGHLAAPSPTHPEAFSAAHLLITPAYASIYQPGQGLLLAAGQFVFGHPWASVLLSTALFLFLLCWAAAPWLPSHWTLATGMLAWCFFFLRHDWAESYWGGSLAACGGALMLGVLGRVLRGDWRFPWFAAGLGAVVLLLTRPYEGGAFGLAIAAVLLWQAWRFDSADRRRLLLRIVLPSAVMITATLAALGWYNAQITGNPLELPYVEYSRQYSMTPPLWLMSTYGEKTYVDEARAAIHQRDLKDYRAILNMPWPKRIVYQILKLAIMNLWNQFQAVSLLLFALPLAALHPRFRPIKFLVAAGFLTLFFEVWMLSHYGAPFTAVQYIAIIAMIRMLWFRMAAAKRVGLLFVPALTLVLVPLVVSWASALMKEPNPRAEFIRKLEQTGDRHLVFTEYAPGWSTDSEWVYNGFNFNERSVMFARWLGEDEMLAVANDFPGRKLWHLRLGPKPEDVRLEPVMVPSSGPIAGGSNKIAAKN